MHPRAYPVQQYSNAAVVGRTIHLTGEQQPISWLQCSRAGRDSPLLGQAKSARVADSAHGERRRLDAAVISPGVVVLAVDAGALVVSRPWLCPWIKWPKAIRTFNIVGVRKRKNSRQRRRSSGGGASEPYPGGRFPRSPLAEVGHRRPFFRRHVVVLLCGWDVVAPRGHLRPSGARESPILWGGCFNQDISKIRKNVTTTLAYCIIRITLLSRKGKKSTGCDEIAVENAL